MRAVALMLLCSCAASSVNAPATLPVRIDETIDGSVCSMEAAQTIALLRSNDRYALTHELIDCQAEQQIAHARESAALAVAERASWWATNGFIITLVSAFASLAGGFALGFALTHGFSLAE